MSYVYVVGLIKAGAHMIVGVFDEEHKIDAFKAAKTANHYMFRTKLNQDRGDDPANIPYLDYEMMGVNLRKYNQWPEMPETIKEAALLKPGEGLAMSLDRGAPNV